MSWAWSTNWARQVRRCGAPLPITSPRMAHLRDALSRACDMLNFDWAVGGRGGVPAAGAGPDQRADQQALEVPSASTPSCRTLPRCHNYTQGDRLRTNVS